ncbi:CRISPR-associated helicase Cas3' [Streptomyces silvisoli]|uniref:CRISPR-associated helicase Cas3 n=1 Tax=Streptomyces silvisoli TaxID=3034235 RepID=A0ABT5ZRB8_9ACTN|nr:CRISPR-associated helicase Cas3' [Streptomyces silvisoli]MDF3292369.1 CRISPR-associated helicase Cas3' [Streptomyces silvisoli]
MAHRREWALDESLWGKSRGLDPGLPPYPLVRHLLDSAAMALFLWDNFLSSSQRSCIAAGLDLAGEPKRVRRLVGLCAGLHDIGKISGFQFCEARAEGWLSDELMRDRGKIGVDDVAHDLAGMKAAPAVLRALGFGNELSSGAAVSRVAEIVGGHHGRFYRPDPLAVSSAREALLGGKAWALQREAHAAAVFDAVGAPELPMKFSAAAAVLVTGVVILADWLVSQEHYLRSRQRRLGPLQGHFGKSLRDAECLAREAGLMPVALERKGFCEAYDIAGKPNALQRSIAEELPTAVGARQPGRRARGGILLVTAAPGDGKSEAALEAERVLSGGFGTRGFAFLLPTMATSDQMHGRVAGVLARQGAGGAGLTLTHSMAWLSKAYADDDLVAGPRVMVCDGLENSTRAEGYQALMRPRWWLRGPKRPLLAQYTVGTVDQALMAVLPVRHNALRMLALSGKTFIVDEAHAYDPYMQVLLGRLLCWLGAYGVPVVLMSATLPMSVSDRLIKEYLKGAGCKQSEERSFSAPYPGWLYVDAETAECTVISDALREEQAAERRMDLKVDQVPVVHGSCGGARDRLAVIERLADPIVSGSGGCMLVVCNTVGNAQATYTWLKERYEDRGLSRSDLQILHARFPGDVREARTQMVTAGLGRLGPRPERRIIVATQVVEQSLDLDADLVVSDLAPLALLLQRAGRCWRHETWWAGQGRPQGRSRPDWAVVTGPRLVVLDPLLDGGGVPRQWGEVYPEFLLAETSKALSELPRATVAIPGDVQDLVERVHGDRPELFHWDDPVRSEQWSAYVGKGLAERSVGGALVIPRPRGVRQLHQLHHLQGTEDEWDAATRLGADSVRLLCVYQQPDGTLTLDVGGDQELPQPGEDGRWAVKDVRRLMGKTIPVRAGWFSGERERCQPPTAWADHPMLSELLVLAQPVCDGQPQPVTVGRRQMWLDEELGLVRQ